MGAQDTPGHGFRIPLALQAVFLASNQGNEVTEAPEKSVASKTFFSSLSMKAGKARFPVPKITWLFKSKPSSKSIGEVIKTADNPLETESVTSAQSDTTLSEVPKAAVPDKINVKKLEEVNEAEESPSDDPQEQESLTPDISPQDYLNGMLACRGYTIETKKTLESGYYASPTPLQNASYHAHLLQIAKDGKNNDLKSIMECGISPNPCNKHGESLVHTVCRRCEADSLRVLLDAGTSLQVSDDYGRTPLHDACWRSTPCFEIIEMIADKDLFMFFLVDARGSLPLAYVAKDHWGQWNRFLESKKDIWWPAQEEAASSAATINRSIADLAPNTRPIPDPTNALKPDIAAMVTAGRVTPKEASFLNMDIDSLESDNEEEECESEDGGEESDYSGSEDEDFSDDDYSSEEDDSDYDSDDSFLMDESEMRNMMGLVASATGCGSCRRTTKV